MASKSWQPSIGPPHEKEPVTLNKTVDRNGGKGTRTTSQMSFHAQENANTQENTD